MTLRQDHRPWGAAQAAADNGTVVRRRAPTAAGAAAGIERVSGEDLMQLASDIGPVPWQVGAILRMDTAPDFDVPAAAQVVAERAAAVPRLRQVLVRVPLGCGRPIWVDDADFDVRRHVRCVSCAAPGDETALLETAAAIASERLPEHRPLWRATFITGLPGAQTALLVVLHHVLADGIGGLAVLARLADGTPVADATAFPRPAPTRRQLAADAVRGRIAALGRLPATLPTLRRAITELNPASAVHAPATTLNGPTGAGRRLVVARAGLGPLRDLAHEHNATVNDVVLTAVTGALGVLLARRGDSAENLVVIVPVSARTSAAITELGNRVGVMAVSLPLRGARIERLRCIAAITRARKLGARGASATLLGPVLRMLAALHLLRWLINRQQMVNVFETNLRGPDRQITIAGNRVTDVLPITDITGNVAMSFAVLSYGGTLAVVVMADPDLQPDLSALASLLQHELDDLAAGASPVLARPQRP